MAVRAVKVRKDGETAVEQHCRKRVDVRLARGPDRAIAQCADSDNYEKLRGIDLCTPSSLSRLFRLVLPDVVLGVKIYSHLTA